MELVGRYEILERIGDGAMADVYRAFDPSIQRVLAIKLLKPEFRRNRQYVARFLRESKAAGALSHPNIVTVYDVGEADDYAYIAMELLDGETLDRVAEREGRLPPETVIAIGLQLADALAYAHGAGVVHRDIKPSNIFLGRDGRTIKILDFGIARMTEEDRALEDAENLKTQVGQVLGTPRYMSPEQALGRELDGRSDQFSAGVVLYELVTGRRAFPGGSAVTLALQITQLDPAPIAELAPETPAGLQFVIAKLLDKRPERRFADAGLLAEALRREQAAYQAAITEAPARSRNLPLPARTALLMASVTAFALAISIGAVLSQQYRAMERMALTSGSAIASFVASNVALTAADNAGLPADQRDWMPVGGFVMAAAADPNVRRLTVVDADGVVQAASDQAQVGRRYLAPSGEPLVRRDAAGTVTSFKAPDGDLGFRFVRPVVYAGRPVGVVDVVVSKAELAAAARLSRLSLAALGLVTLLVVAAASLLVARRLSAPIRRLKAALEDAAAGDLDFRISHRRRDEFGELFDSFNRCTTAVQERLAAVPPGPPARPVLAVQGGQAVDAASDLDRTVVGAA